MNVNLAVHSSAAEFMTVLPSVGVGRRDQAADHGDPCGFGGDLLGCFSILRDERRTLHQVARRVAANRKFRKKDQARSRRLGAAGVFNHLGGVAGEISDCRIDLA